MSTASVNGTEIYYVTTGEGLLCLVMHGGLGFDHTYLHPSLDTLGDKLNLIYYDHRGNGRSGRPDKETMTHAQFVEDAIALADHLGFDKVGVVGHSYGGFIALQLALHYPERLSHLILLDTAPALNYDDEIFENALRQGATEEMLEVLSAEFASDEEMREKLPIIWPLYFKNYNEETCNRLLENSILTINGGVREGEAEANNMVSHLKDIQIPTLVLAGRYDFVCPPSQAQIWHEGLPNSELAIFENSGHLPYIEEPDLFFKTVRVWFERTP